MPQETRLPIGKNSNSPGPYLAKVVSHLDPYYMGSLEVQLLHEVGNDYKKEGQLHIVKYMSPFAGSTSIEFVADQNDFNNTQKSYGWWAVPPDPGATVIVIFIEGDPRKGYWIGCVQDEDMNFMTPGLAATSYHLDGEFARVPVAEYNKRAQSFAPADTTKIKKPVHPFAEVLKNQGLVLDDIRGITTSSARREIPSSVFGISTPGPIDKRSGAKKGNVGKKEHEIRGAFVSRLGGASFVMDDGDDKWERRALPSEGPPEYVSLEEGKVGLRDRPHNELVRIRTRTGHQILLHNSEDLIYIGNARGTAWIELSSDGKIDIYANDSISVHTKQDMNFYADRDINLEAGRNINVKANKEMQLEAVDDYNLIAGKNGKITIGSDFDLNSGGHNWFTAGGATDIKSGGNHTETATQIHMNGPAAATAVKAVSLKMHNIVGAGGDVYASLIVRRMPTEEPWPHHENLDPQAFKPTATDRDSQGRRADNTGNTAVMSKTPEFWKKYTTITDTFAKVKSD